MEPLPRIAGTKRLRRIGRINAGIFIVVALSACSTPPPDNSTGQKGATIGDCVVSGGTNGGMVTQNCQVAARIRPYLPMLQKYYTEGARIFDSLENDPLTIDQLRNTIKKSQDWRQRTYSWLQSHVTPAAAERFAIRDRPTLGWDSHTKNLSGPDYQSEQDALNMMMVCLQNLNALMASDEMFPQ